MSGSIIFSSSTTNPHVKVHPGTAVSYDAIIAAAGGHISITGTGTDASTSTFVDASDSKVTVKSGAELDLTGNAAGDISSSLVIGPGGTFIEGADADFGAVTHFSGMGVGTAVFDQASLTDIGPITGFTNGDVIDLADIVATSGSYDSATGMLSLFDGTTLVGDLAITGAGLKTLGMDGQHLTFTPDGLGGTEIGLACFLPETLILTETGLRPAREIAIGDQLVTRSGAAKPVKFVGRRSYTAAVASTDPHVAPVTIRRGALDGVLPERDLSLSPCHAMFLDGVLIPAGELVNGVSIVRAPFGETVDYYNFEFEDREMIFAEGAVTESGRARANSDVYDNWHEYLALYPNEAPELQAKAYPVPRLDCGFQVEAVRQRINALAGLATEDSSELGGLDGWVAKADRQMIVGVAWNTASPAPVVLELVIDGDVVGDVVANHFRSGRLGDGHGNGLCGFQVRLPEGLSPYDRHIVSLRRKADGVALAGTPFLMEAAVELTGTDLAAAIDDTGNVAAIDRALAVLASSGEALLQAKADLAGHRADRTAAPMRRGWSDVAANTNGRRAA